VHLPLLLKHVLLVKLLLQIEMVSLGLFCSDKFSPTMTAGERKVNNFLPSSNKPPLSALILIKRAAASTATAINAESQLASHSLALSFAAE
jgi:hypothetical protein